MKIWLKLNAYIYGSQGFAKLCEQPSYILSVMYTCSSTLFLDH